MKFRIERHKTGGCMSQNELFIKSFIIKGGDFSSAGEASVSIKNILKDIGFDSSIIRRAAVASYEAEMNMVMHGGGGVMEVQISPYSVNIIAEDQGPGIPDIAKAMEEGFSTASDEIREMGFGAGMGLPNIRKNSDDFKIHTEVNKGTRLEIIIKIKET
jgi:serine/threonine-protein kinase RsbT